MRADCPVCQGTGFELKTGPRGVATAAPCRCGLKDRSEELLRAAGIPKRYDHCSLATFEDQNKSQEAARRFAADWIARWPKTEQGLLFVGPPGTGKTHLAVAIARELIQDKGARVRFYEQRELLKALRGTFDEGSSRTESEVLDPIREAEVLIIDDLGAGRLTAWSHDVMHDIIAHRYSAKLPLIMTSNHLLGDERERAEGKAPYADRMTLRDRMGQALMSRLYEMCRIISVEGDDYRRGVLHAKIRY